MRVEIKVLQYQCSRNIRVLGVVAAVSLMALLAAFAAYKTHTKSDSDLFFKAYPQVIGTKLDGCDVCHVRIEALPPGQKCGKNVILSNCDSCHFLTDHGRKQGNTLTPFGRDYLKNGRNSSAFASIAAIDSDGDGASNIVELEARTNCEYCHPSKCFAYIVAPMLVRIICSRCRRGRRRSRAASRLFSLRFFIQQD
jgi:hypothetical protein